MCFSKFLCVISLSWTGWWTYETEPLTIRIVDRTPEERIHLEKYFIMYFGVPFCRIFGLAGCQSHCQEQSNYGHFQNIFLKKFYKMHRKHRPHRHHRESKLQNISTSKKMHKSGHKHHEVHHVSFETPQENPKPDKNACGDFQRKSTGNDEKRTAKHSEKSKIFKEQKLGKVENYLKELTKPQPDYVTKHASLDRGDNMKEFKRERSFGNSLPNPPNLNGNIQQVVPKHKVKESTSTKPKHRSNKSTERHSNNRKYSRRKHHKEKDDSCERKSPHKDKPHTHKIVGDCPERKCKGKVQEVLFYQISPTSYNVKTDKNPTEIRDKNPNEIKDLYHRSNKRMSQERKLEKTKAHRHSSKVDNEEYHRHRINKDKRVKSAENNPIQSPRIEKLSHSEKCPTVDRENSKQENVVSKEIKNREIRRAHENHGELKHMIKAKTEKVDNEYLEQKERKTKEKLKNSSTVDRSFQEKMENDMKNYFGKIQKLIDKKLELILNNKLNSPSPASQKNEESSRKLEKHSESIKEVEIMSRDKQDHKIRRHRLKDSTVTFEEIKKEKHRKRLSKKSPENIARHTEKATLQENRSNPPQIPYILMRTDGLSNMPSDQSKITNQLDPPYESIFPPELWNLKMRELILASQNVPPTLCDLSSGDLLRQKHALNIKNIENQRTVNSNFVVQGVEPPSLERFGRKLKKKERKLESKTVSVIGIEPHAHAKELKATQEIDTQKTPTSASDELVEKRKRSKRFKIYYKYSVEDNAHLVSSEGKSVVSDSYRIVNDPDDEELKIKCPQINRTKSLKQELVQNINIKPLPKCNKNRRIATPVQSVLNNIVEEPSTSVTQCYFKGLTSSNSESCLKINKKSARSSISVRSKPPSKRVCKYCRPKSDVTIPSRATSRVFKSKSDVVLDSSNAKQLMKAMLRTDNHRRRVDIVRKIINTQESQTSDYKISEEEERRFEIAYYNKKEQFKEIYKTLEYLEDGIQTVSQNYISKKVFVDAGVGSETILENTKNTRKKVLENKEVSTEGSTEQSFATKTERNKAKLKDIAIGDSNEPKQLEIRLKSTGCSPICIRGPKSPMRRQQQTPGPNDFRQSISSAPRRAKKVDTSPPKPVPRQSVMSKPLHTRKPVIPPTQVIVLRDTSTNAENEAGVGTRMERIRNTPRCSRGKDVSRPQSVRQPSNVEELLRGVAEEDGNQEMLRKEVSVGDGNTKSSKPMKQKVTETRQMSQTRSTTFPKPTTPITRQATDVNKKAPKTFNIGKEDADVDGCLHVLNPRDKKPAVRTGELEARCFSVNRAELKHSTISKKISGSTSSSVSDTAIQRRAENRDEPRRSKSLVEIETYKANTSTSQEPQIYSHTEAILTTQRIKTRLEKFNTEPQSRWYRTKSNVQSLDQYDEKFKSTMLLTKQDKTPGLSSYQKRKTYDAFRRQKLKNNVQSNLPQQVYYNINNIVNHENLYDFDHKKDVILENFANRKHFLNTPENSILETTREIHTPESNIGLPKKSSIITLFVNKYRDANHSKLLYFYQKLLQVSSSLEFPFNLNETCSCKEISENCQACLHFINNLGALFTEATLSYHKNDMSGFADNYNNLTINIDNEVFDFYNNEEFNSESLVDEYSLRSDDHDTDTSKNHETMSKICKELLPGKFCEKFFVKSKYNEESSDPSTSFSKPTSCPILQDNTADFEYLYDDNESSSSKESIENTYVNMNMNQYNVETPPVFENNVINLDTSESSGYESVESKSKSKVQAHRSFFKKPNIAALFKPCNISKKKSNITTDNETLEQKKSDYIDMVKDCHVYASRIRDYKESKDSISEEYKELPLKMILSHKFEDELVDSELKIGISDPNVEDIKDADDYTRSTNPFSEDNLTDSEQDELPRTRGCKIVSSNEAWNVESITYFVPEIFLEPENVDDEKSNYNLQSEHSVEQLPTLDDLSKNAPRKVSSDQFVAKRFFNSLLNAYEAESKIYNKIYEDTEFLSREVFPIIEREKNKCKRKGFTSFFRRKCIEQRNIVSQETKLIEDNRSLEYRTTLRELSSHARKCFCMLADAVKRNKNIDEDEIKFCGLLKMLEKIENGDCQIMQQNSNNLPIEDIVKNQVIDSFVSIYETCQKEAKKHRRTLSLTEVNLIKAFVTKFRAGLLSKTDVVAIYISRGQIHSESQLKAAVTFLMHCKSEEIDQEEFENYCGINYKFNRK